MTLIHKLDLDMVKMLYHHVKNKISRLMHPKVTDRQTERQYENITAHADGKNCVMLQ